MNVYQGVFKSVCPSDGDNIIYTYTIYSDNVLMVEDINRKVSLFKQAYHEQCADDLFSEFGGKQIMEATHQGVKIITYRF